MINKIKRILGRTFPDFTIRDGRPVADLLVKPSAAINEQFEVEKQNLLEKVYLDNYNRMTTDELDLLLSNYLYTKRNSGRFSSGIVRIYVSQKCDIVLDQRKGIFQDIKGRRYIPRFDFAISTDNLSFDYITGNYYVDIVVISEQPFGGEFLIKKGEINTYLGSNPFIKSVTNTEDFVLVDILETNSELYQRIKERGIILNQTRSNFLPNLIYQTFPDIRKIMVAGTNHALMERDLTFDNIDASSAIINYNFFRKKYASTVDNKNILFKGLADSNSLDDLDVPQFYQSIFTEASQSDYESITFKDANSAVISSLLFEDLFALFNGVNDLAFENWTFGETGKSWNTGSSFVNFTGDFNKGIEIKGEYLKDPLLATGDRGLAFYKEIGDIRNTEYSLGFIIEDFTTTQTETTAKVNTNNSITISNNNPLYFTVLKKGQKDKSDIKISSFDGYGVAIMKTFPDARPNVYIIDGSTAIGSQAFEEQILALGSERILAAKEIPLSAGVKYFCIVQINEQYGMKVTFRDEFNSEVGQLSVGSGANLPEFLTTYSLTPRNEEKLISENVTSVNPPVKFEFSSTDAVSILDLLYLAAQSSTSEYYLKNYQDSRRIVYIDTANSAIPFLDFGNVEIGDTIEFAKKKYLITNKYSHKQIELDSDVPSLGVSGTQWKAWKTLIPEEDYTRPRTATFNNFILLKNGRTKIEDIIGIANFSELKLKINYIQDDGVFKYDILIDWISSYADGEMKSYLAPVSPDPTSVDLLEVNFFNNTLEDSTDYFYTAPGVSRFNSIYLTQVGFNKVKSSKLKFVVNDLDSVNRTVLRGKNEYNAGYYLPLQYAVGVDNITYIDKVYAKNSGFVYNKNVHYRVFDSPITDILIEASYYSLFSGLIQVDTEVIGTGDYANVSTTASSIGNNKIYIDTGTISDTDYFTVSINRTRYFIQSINLSESNPPFTGKTISLTLDKNVPLLDNIEIDIRKKYSISVSSNILKFGYRYDVRPEDQDLLNSNIDPVVKYGDRNLIKGEDFESDRTIPITYYYIAKDLYESLNASDDIIFTSEYREVLEEKKFGKGFKFSPISSGSYLGIGFKTISNSHWKLLEIRSRKLAEQYSGFLIKNNVGDKPISTQDRIQIKLSSYGINTNSSTPLNGVVVFIYNYDTSKWEKLYENNAASPEEGSVTLQYYDGTEEGKEFDFGYWDGSIFSTQKSSFYVTDYVSPVSKEFSLLILTRGKNEKDFSGNLAFGEAKLFLDFFDLIWQRKRGVHLGNKLDIWVASSAQTTNETVNITLTDSTKSYTLTSDNFKFPIKKINSIKILGQNIPIGFALVNSNKNLRFSNKEELVINFTNTLSPGTYEVNYEYFPHVGTKQQYIDNLQYHIDCLIKQFAPVDVSINMGYNGTLDTTLAKDLIIQYLRFGNVLSVDVIINILTNLGATSVFSISGLNLVEVSEYDIEEDPKTKIITSSYSLKEYKFFDISRDNINLVKIA